MTAIFDWGTSTHNVFKMLRSCQGLVHTHILIIAVIEAFVSVMALIRNHLNFSPTVMVISMLKFTPVGINLSSLRLLQIAFVFRLGLIVRKFQLISSDLFIMYV
jgi:hypothetical protein